MPMKTLANLAPKQLRAGDRIIATDYSYGLDSFTVEREFSFAPGTIVVVRSTIGTKSIVAVARRQSNGSWLNAEDGTALGYTDLDVSIWVSSPNDDTKIIFDPAEETA